MLSKKSIKIITVALVAIIMFLFVASPCFAALADKFKADTSVVDGKADTLVTKILGYMKYVGIAVAVGMMIYLGIKYVTSSPDGKADLKGKLGVYILGLVLIIAATSIVAILENGIESATAFAISQMLMH